MLVRASSTEVALMLRGAWRPLRFGLLTIGIELGAGINIVRLRAKPVIIEGADQTVTTPIEGLFRGGPVLDLALVGDWVHVFLRGGILLRVPSAGIDFHETYGVDGPISTGNYGPYLDGGVSVRFF